MPPRECPRDDEPRIARLVADRRRRPTGPWDAFRLNGRRARPRRVEDRASGHFTDRFDGATFVLTLLLLVMTVVDGAMTLMLLDGGSEEANPVMRFLLERGPVFFLIGKYALTAAGVPFLLIYRNFTVFGTRFRIGYLIPVFVGFYFLVIGYQVALIQTEMGPPSASFSDRSD